MKSRWKIAQAAEIRWWKGYLKKKDIDSYLQWKKNYWKNFLIKCNLNIPINSLCLDAGCGPAGIFMILNDQKTDAIDPLLNNYANNLKHFNPANYPNVNFITAPLEQINLTKEYDYTFCLNAINHVSDLELCFNQLFTFTKKGGTLIISIDSHNYSLIKYLFRIIPGDILHPHQYTLKEYEQMAIIRKGIIIESINYQKGYLFDYYIMVIKKE
ncbi:MAG: class I SAM-dependent methyltransferase [Saprospiraceae bacterium]|nr:class I SAM-dependent methyltransferase [Saprospiraceae bacterium]